MPTSKMAFNKVKAHIEALEDQLTRGSHAYEQYVVMCDDDDAAEATMTTEMAMANNADKARQKAIGFQQAEAVRTPVAPKMTTTMGQLIHQITFHNSPMPKYLRYLLLAPTHL